MAYVYRHIRLDVNQPFYIGIGSDSLFKRAFESKSNRRNSIWNKIVSKTSYRVEILFENLSWEEACIKEIEFISLYGRKNINTGVLCNLTDGGEGTLNCIPSKETKALLKIRMTGSNNPMYGKTHSPEIIEQIRLKNLGRKAPNKGKPMSERQKLLLSSVKKGSKAWNKGLKNVNGLGLAKTVLDLTTGIFYESCKEAAFSLSYKPSTLRSMLNGINKNKSSFIYI
jgi:hypothetical protein